MANITKETIQETLTAVVAELFKQGIKAEVINGYFVFYLNANQTTLVEVRFDSKCTYRLPSIHASNAYSITLCSAKSFQPDAKNLVGKLVENIVERCRELELDRKREQAKELRLASAKAGLTNLVADYPQFSRALSTAGDGTLNLQFKGISESKAREILMTLEGAKVTV